MRPHIRIMGPGGFRARLYPSGFAGKQLEDWRNRQGAADRPGEFVSEDAGVGDKYAFMFTLFYKKIAPKKYSF